MSSLNDNENLSKKETYMPREKNKSSFILTNSNSILLLQKIQNQDKNTKEKQNPRYYRFLINFKITNKDIKKATSMTNKLFIQT